MAEEEKIVKPIFKTPPPKEEKVVEEEEVEVSEEEKAEELPPAVSPDDYYLSSPLFHKVADYFDLSPTQREIQKNKLSVIVDWATMESNSADPAEVLFTIKQLAHKVGHPIFPILGGTKLPRVYRLVLLMGKKRQVEKEIEVYTQEEGDKNG